MPGPSVPFFETAQVQAKGLRRPMQRVYLYRNLNLYDPVPQCFESTTSHRHPHCLFLNDAFSAAFYLVRLAHDLLSTNPSLRAVYHRPRAHQTEICSLGILQTHTRSRSHALDHSFVHSRSHEFRSIGASYSPLFWQCCCHAFCHCIHVKS